MAIVNFYRGLKEKYNQTTHKDGLYFSTDTLEIMLNGDSFGGGGLKDVIFSEGKLIFSFTNGSNMEVTIDEATQDLPGLLSAADKKRLEDTIKKTEDNTSLIVKLHAVITATAGATNIYKGENTNVNINHSATFDGSPLTYTLIVDGEELANPYSLNDSKTFNIAFNIDNADPKLNTVINKTIRVNAYYPRYYGRVDKTTLVSEDVLALTKQPVASSAASSNKTFTSSVADYLWLCVPDSMSVKGVTSGGFAVPMEPPITVAVSEKGDYRCYRTTNKVNAGSVTYNIV